MDKLNFSWDTVKTEYLIQMKHSQKFIEKFKSAIGKPHKQAACWVELGQLYTPPCAGREVKIKYNALLFAYRNRLSARKTTGNAVVKPWKYMDLFSSTYPSKQDEVMKDIEDLGTDRLSETQETWMVSSDLPADALNLNVPHKSTTHWAASSDKMDFADSVENVCAPKKKKQALELKELKKLALSTYINKNSKHTDNYVTKEEFTSKMNEILSMNEEIVSLLKKLMEK